MRKFFKILTLSTLFLTLGTAIYYLSWPGFTRLRFLLSAFILMILAGLFLKSSRLKVKLVSLTLVFALLFQLYQFHSYRGVFMKTNSEVLQNLGQHFIVGYHELSNLAPLIERGSIGGVFVSSKNIEGKSFAQVREELFNLQKEYQRLHGKKLIIATDQEGGLVTKLSPLVPAQEEISKLLLGNPNDTELRLRVQNYALTQATALEGLGVNVNFSPVVDLKPVGAKNFSDTKTLIEYRAISEDPQLVTKVAKIYAETLFEKGITPTLKHFPGIGKIKQDTHFKIGELDLSKEELEKQDWIPFKEILSQSSSWLMMGHVKLQSVDSKELVSLSSQVVDDLLRKEWNYSGIIVTDDFSMGPIYSRNGGVGKASVDALNAGVDYILISYDPDLYYEAMASLISAYERRSLNTVQLEKSKLRQEQHLKNLNSAFAFAQAL